MDNISTTDQSKNAQDIYNFLATQGNDICDLKREDTTFTALLSDPEKNQAKLVYEMGLGTARIGKTPPIASKILTLYGEGDPAISRFQQWACSGSTDTEIQKCCKRELNHAHFIHTCIHGVQCI